MSDWAETVSLNSVETVVIAVRGTVASIRFPDAYHVEPVALNQTVVDKLISTIRSDANMGNFKFEPAQGVKFTLDAKSVEPLIAVIAKAWAQVKPPPFYGFGC